MSESRQIGRVFVQVSPDTRGFAREAERELDRQIARHGGLTADAQVEVGDVDTLAASRSIERLSERLDDLSDRAERAMRNRSLTVSIDQSAFQQTNQALERIERKMDDINDNISVLVSVTTNDLELRRTAERVEDLQEATRTASNKRVNLSFDQHEFLSVMGAIRRVDEALDELDRRNNVRIGVDMDANALATARQHLRELADDADITLRVGHSEASLQAAIGRINQAIREMQDDAEVEVRVEKDISALVAQRQQFEAHIRAMQDEAEIELRFHKDESSLLAIRTRIRDMIREIEDDGIELGIDPERLRTNLAMVEQRINETRRRIENEPIELRVSKDRTSLDRALETIQRRMRELDREEIEISVEIDRTSLQRASERIEDLIEEYDQEEITLNANADTLKARTMLAVASRRRYIDFVARVDEQALAHVVTTMQALAGFRVVDDTFQNMRRFFEDIDQKIPRLIQLNGVLGGLSIIVGTVAANMFSLAGDIVRFAAVAYVLPGTVAAAAAAFWVLNQAFRTFSEQLPDVYQRFQDLNQLISDDFYNAARGPIQRLINSHFPALQSGMRDLATQLGGVFGDLANEMYAAFAPDVIPMFLAATTESVNVLRGMTGGLVSILDSLFSITANYLPRMTGWLVDIVNGFADWLAASIATGRAHDWIAHAEAQFHSLISIIGSVIRIVIALGEAGHAAGGIGLVELANGLRATAAGMESIGFQSGAVMVLRQANHEFARMAQEVGPRLTEFFRDFSSVFTVAMAEIGPAIESIVTGFFDALNSAEFQRGFLDMVHGTAVALDAIGEMVAQSGAGVGALLSLIGTMATHYGPIVATMWTHLLDLFERIGPSLENLATGGGQLTLRMLDLMAQLMIPVIDALLRFTGYMGATEVGFAILVGGLLTLKGILALPTIISGLIGIGTAMTKLKGVLAGGNLAVQFGNFASQLGTLGIVSGTTATKLGAGAVSMGKLAVKLAPIIAMGAKILAPIGIAAALIALAVGMEQSEREARMAVPSLNDFNRVLLDMGAGREAADALDELVRASTNIRGGVPATTEAVAEMHAGMERAAAAANWHADALADLNGDILSLQQPLLQARSFTETLAESQDGAAHSVLSFADAFRVLSDSTLAGTPAQERANALLVEFEGALDKAANAGHHEAVAAGMTAMRESAYQAGISMTDMANESVDAMLRMEYAAFSSLMQQAMALDGAMDGWNRFAYVLGSDVLPVTADLHKAIMEGSARFYDLRSSLSYAEQGLSSWKDAMRDQIAAQNTWADNMAEITRRGVDQGTLAELARLGPEGAVLVQQLRDACDTYLAEAVSLMGGHMTTGTNSVIKSFSQMNQNSLALWNAFHGDAQRLFEVTGHTFDQGGRNITLALARAIEETQGVPRARALEMAMGVERTVQENIDLETPGRLAAAALGAAISAGHATVFGAAMGLGNQVPDGIRRSLDMNSPSRVMQGLGDRAALGFSNGLGSGSAISRVVGAAQRLANAIPSSIRNLLGMSSPSRVLTALGYDAGASVANGLSNSVHRVEDEARLLAYAINDALEDNINPVVTPQFDAANLGSNSARANRNFMAAQGQATDSGNRTLIYNAAPGSSLGSEEDLFAAAARGRMVW